MICFLLVRAFGLIGGGAVLAFAAGAGGLGLLGPAVGIGVVGKTYTNYQLYRHDQIPAPFF